MHFINKLQSSNLMQHNINNLCSSINYYLSLFNLNNNNYENKKKKNVNMDVGTSENINILKIRS